MNQLFFWKDWQKNYRILYFFLLSVFVFSFLFCAFAYSYEFDWLFSLEINSELKSTKFILDEIQQGLFNIPLETEMFVFQESFDTANLEPARWIYYLYASLIFIAVIFLLTVVTSLRQIWFFAGMAVFLFFLSYMNFDYLGLLPKNQNAVLIIALIAYGGAAFYFQSFNRNMAFHWRMAVFALITLAFGIWIGLKTQVNFPLVFLVNYGIVVPIILTLLFISLTAHDIVYAFFHLIIKYNAEGGKNNIVHFTVISLIYLANLFLLYLQQSDYLQLDFYYIDLIWLFFTAAILGIWGFKRRNILIAQYLPFYPQAAFAYLALGIVGLSTMSFALVTSNDALADVFKDFILYSYLGFGLIFYLYVITNFAQLIREKTDVLEVVYDGQLLPYFMLRYLSFAIVIALFANNKQMLYYQSVAAYYNGVGDIYRIEKNNRLAKEYYELASNYDYFNRRSHFYLAAFARNEGDEVNETLHLRQTLFRQPLEYAYLRLGNVLAEGEVNYNGLFKLREGTKFHPKSLAINNNLALLYHKNALSDSAFYYVDIAEKNASKSTIPQNNLWALLAENTVKNFKIETLPKIKNEKNNLIGKVNKLALYTNYRTNLSFSENNPALLQKADNLAFAYIYNYALNKLNKPDSLALAQIESFEKTDKKGIYAAKIQFVKACYLYYNGQVNTGIQLLASMPYIQTDAYYNTILGLWLVQQNAFRSAGSYLEKAIDLGNEQAKLYRAIVLSELGETEKAVSAWQEVFLQKNKNTETIALQMLKAMSDTASLTDDRDKYIFIHYKKNEVPLPVLEEIYNTMEDLNFKTQAAADLINYYLNINQVARAENIYLSLSPSDKVRNPVKSEINHAYLRLLAAGGEYDKILREIDGLTLQSIHQNKKDYFKALALDKKGEIKKAESFYLKAQEAAPFDEEVSLATAAYYENHKKNIDKAYQILVNAVRLSPYSLNLLKGYALISLKMGLEYYGEDTMPKIQRLTNKEDFAAFEKIYTAQKKAMDEFRLKKLNKGS